MNRNFAILLIPALISGVLIVGLFTTSVDAQSPAAERKTVWKGIYTDEQASRGQAIFETTCVNCHGATLAGGASMGGPQLAGDKFMENWREDTVETLFLKIRNTMPRAGFQGSDRTLTD